MEDYQHVSRFDMYGRGSLTHGLVSAGGGAPSIAHQSSPHRAPSAAPSRTRRGPGTRRRRWRRRSAPRPRRRSRPRCFSRPAARTSSPRGAVGRGRYSALPSSPGGDGRARTPLKVVRKRSRRRWRCVMSIWSGRGRGTPGGRLSSSVNKFGGKRFFLKRACECGLRRVLDGVVVHEWIRK